MTKPRIKKNGKPRGMEEPELNLASMQEVVTLKKEEREGRNALLMQGAPTMSLESTVPLRDDFVTPVKQPAKVKVTEFKANGISTGFSCHETHPSFDIGEGLMIDGGNCGHPKVKDADIYIGFQTGMASSNRRYPWVKGHEFQFVIEDRRAPKDPVEFDRMVDWTIKQLKAGLKVHAGCIGGHGRTGTFLAALRARMGDPDPITTVRTLYCSKAIETQEQIDFLVKYYDAKPQAPRPMKVYAKSKTAGSYGPYDGYASLEDKWGGATTYSGKQLGVHTPGWQNKRGTGAPIYPEKSIWGY